MKFRAPAFAALLLLPLATLACSKTDDTPAAAPATDTAAPLETALPDAAETPAEPAAPLSLNDVPGPAAGKWQIEATMDGRTLPATEVCYSQSTLAALAETPEGTTCSEQTVDRSGGTIRIHAVCTSSDGMKTVMDNVVTGDLTSAYTSDMTMSFDPPPRPGMSSMHMVASAKRLGDC
jgi:hypothetical protein